MGGSDRFVMWCLLLAKAVLLPNARVNVRRMIAIVLSFIFLPFLKYIFLECLREHYPVIIRSGTDTIRRREGIKT